jgi:hypothetical protein
MNKVFWRDTFERAIKTAVQSVLLAIVGATGADLFALDWQTIGIAAFGGAVLSVLTSIGSLPFGPAGSPSVVAVAQPVAVPVAMKIATKKPEGL